VRANPWADTNGTIAATFRPGQIGTKANSRCRSANESSSSPNSCDVTFPSSRKSLEQGVAYHQTHSPHGVSWRHSVSGADYISARSMFPGPTRASDKSPSLTRSRYRKIPRYGSGITAIQCVSMRRMWALATRADAVKLLENQGNGAGRGGDFGSFGTKRSQVRILSARL
jgi:hypothetical protein